MLALPFTSDNSHKNEWEIYANQVSIQVQICQWWGFVHRIIIWALLYSFINWAEIVKMHVHCIDPIHREKIQSNSWLPLQKQNGGTLWQKFSFPPSKLFLPCCFCHFVSTVFLLFLLTRIHPFSPISNGLINFINAFIPMHVRNNFMEKFFETKDCYIAYFSF